MSRKTHHVVHDSDGGWNVKKGGADRISGHATSKEKAISIGREISKNQGTELLIHGLDGKIQQADSHGHDPRSIKG